VPRNRFWVEFHVYMQIPRATRVLVVIDQFEELFTTGTGKDEQLRYINTLLAGVPNRNRSPCPCCDHAAGRPLKTRVTANTTPIASPETLLRGRPFSSLALSRITPISAPLLETFWALRRDCSICSGRLLIPARDCCHIIRCRINS
jgi:hypothetical protein